MFQRNVISKKQNPHRSINDAEPQKFGVFLVRRKQLGLIERRYRAEFRQKLRFVASLLN
jgi:hypothetical protein